jgi:hypothetical protein
MKKQTKKRTPTIRANSRKHGTALPRRQFPAHLSATPDEWRALKRTEWREVTQAIERYNLGSAYTPSHSALWNIQRLAQQITEALEDPEWIAW